MNSCLVADAYLSFTPSFKEQTAIYLHKEMIWTPHATQVYLHACSQQGVQEVNFAPHCAHTTSQTQHPHPLPTPPPVPPHHNTQVSPALIRGTFHILSPRIYLRITPIYGSSYVKLWCQQSKAQATVVPIPPVYHRRCVLINITHVPLWQTRDCLDLKYIFTHIQFTPVHLGIHKRWSLKA